MEKDEIMLLSEVDQRSQSNERRIKKLEDTQSDISKMVESLGVMKNEQEHIKTDVSEIKTSIKTLAEKPAKRWDGLIDKLFWLVVGGIVAAALASLGLT